MVRRATHDRGAPYPTTATNRGDVERISASRSSVRAALRGRHLFRCSPPVTPHVTRLATRTTTCRHPRADRCRPGSCLSSPPASARPSPSPRDPRAHRGVPTSRPSRRRSPTPRSRSRSGTRSSGSRGDRESSPRPRVGTPAQSRATCLGGLSRWTDAERARTPTRRHPRARARILGAGEPGPRRLVDPRAGARRQESAARAIRRAGHRRGGREQTRARLGGRRGRRGERRHRRPHHRAPRGFARRPTVAQRLGLQRGEPRWGAGDVGFAANALARLDKGPSPVAGRGGQFWEARAALAAALYANGSLPAAEAEWSLANATRAREASWRRRRIHAESRQQGGRRGRV